MIRKECTSCTKAFAIDETSNAKQFRCPHCGVANTLSQPATPTASNKPFVPAAPKPTAAPLPTAAYAEAPAGSSGSIQSSWRLPIILGLSCLLLFLVLAGVGGYLAYQLSRPEPIFVSEVKDASPADLGQTNPYEASDLIDTIPKPKTASPPDNPFSAADRGTSSSPSSRPATTPATAGSSNPRSNSNSAYNFGKGQEYSYDVRINSKISDVPVGMFGSVSYTVSEQNPTELSRKEKREFFKDEQPDNNDQLFLMKYSGSTHLNGGGGGRLPQGFDLHTYGDLICNQNGKVLGTRDRNVGLGSTNSLVQFIFEPIHTLPLVDLSGMPKNSWQEKRKLNLKFYPPEDRFGNGRLPPQPYRLFFNAKPENFYGGGPTASSVLLNVVSDYKLVSETDELIVYKRVVKATPESQAKISVSFERTDEIEFDRTKNVIANIGSKGECRISTNSIITLHPFDFEIELEGIKSAEVVAKETQARKEKSARVKAVKDRGEGVVGNPDKSVSSKASDVFKDNMFVDFGRVSSSIKSTIWSADSKFLFCANYNDLISLDVAKQTKVWERDGIKQVSVMAVCKDHLYTGNRDGVVTDWKINADGKLEQFRTMVGHKGGVTSLAVDFENKLLLSGGDDKTGRLWELEKGTELTQIEGFNGKVEGCGFLSDKSTAMFCCDENVIYLDLETHAVDKVETFRNSSTQSFAFSPTGEEFAFSNSSEVEVYDAATAARKSTIKKISGVVWKISYSSDGKHLLLGSNSLSIWDASSAKHLSEIRTGKSGYVQVFAASPDGKFLATMNSSGSTPVVVVNPVLEESARKEILADVGMVKAEDGTMKKGPIYGKFELEGSSSKAMLFSPNGKFFYAEQNRGIRVFDVARRRDIQDLARFDEGQVTAMACSPDSKKLLAGTYEGKVLIFDIADDGTLQRTGVYVGHTKAIKSIGVGPNGNYVISGEDKRARIWELDSQKEALSVDFKKEVTACGILPNGRAAVATDGTQIKIMTFKPMKVWKEFLTDESYSRATLLSDDGLLLANKGFDGLGIYDTKTGKKQGKINSKASSDNIIFLPDNKHILICDRGTMRIWSVKKKTVVKEIETGGSSLQEPAVSKDGKLIAVQAGYGDGITVYNSPIED